MLLEQTARGCSRLQIGLRLAAGLLVAVALAGCIGGIARPNASALPSASTSARQSLCADLAAAYAERGSLADAFRSAIAGDLVSAQAQAAAIQARMAGLIDGLPPVAPLASASSELRDIVENAAQLMSASAKVLDPASGKIDPLKALPDGQVLLRTLDMVMSTEQPGSPTAVACPAVSYVAAEVSFPPAPGNAAFGLPDTVGGWSLEPRVGGVGYLESALQSLGIDPSAVRLIRVDMTDSGRWEEFDVFDGVSAPPKEILAALPGEMFDGVSKTTASRTVNGFAVVRRGDPTPGEITVTVAVRGSRAVLFSLVPQDLIDAILRATP
jgi:hypothetical protein